MRRRNYKTYILWIFTVLFIILISCSIYHIFEKQEKDILIPRKLLFENEDRSAVAISPDGTWLSYLAPSNGVLNIWIQNLETNQTKLLSHENTRGINFYYWAYDNQHILYLKDLDGDENWQLYKLNIATGISTLLTAEKGAQARVIDLSYLHPNKIIIGLNDRNPIYHDLYEVDINTGLKKLILKNNEFKWFFFNDDQELVFAQKTGEKGRNYYYVHDGLNKWKLYRTVEIENVLDTAPLALDTSKKWVYWLDNEDTDKTNLVKINLKTGKKITLYKGSMADVNYAWISTVNKDVLAVGENYLKQEVIPLNSEIKKDFDFLNHVDNGEMQIVNSNLYNDKWVIMFGNDDKISRYYIYNRNTKKINFLFYGQKKLANIKFVKMQPVEIKSRDGLTLVSYLSLPANRKINELVPMVLLVHGGPFGVRDIWGFNVYQQWLANRGYAVLSVNYRGSSGFGKAFAKAGYGEYGRKMQEDLIDAVEWAIKNGIADPKKIAIYGGSYGGYAALLGITITPDIFACAVDEVGIANLITFLETIPPYWKTDFESLKLWTGGDVTTLAGRRHLLNRSPIKFVDKIKKPLLIAHGANDPRVKKSESDQIVNVMQKKGIPVTYVLFPDEGHGFVNPKNRLANVAINEAFLQQTLGGWLERISSEVKESSAQIIAGNATIK